MVKRSTPVGKVFSSRFNHYVKVRECVDIGAWNRHLEQKLGPQYRVSDLRPAGRWAEYGGNYAFFSSADAAEFIREAQADMLNEDTRW